ncbi:hypothetical protein [Pseudohongiella spirulinae]|uniref:Uncharacterized protein n=1 Tax=Pseudohongiella spirulinae TaxID=1249552 RepID=A0A0S2KEE7_9GAMM|nr:hypothetical protein [Pseudohongiella spirulinae]ALO46685.1 hypothetical protein PS2015_2046 [Pseudohongiella spirulinae]
MAGILRKLRQLLWTTLLLIALLTVVLPALLGFVLRQQINPLLLELGNRPTEPGQLTLHLDRVDAGLLRSDYYLYMTGNVLSVSGTQPASQRLLLSVAHGPVIWHLFDSLLAIAEIQLINLSPVTGADTPHLSGSALLTLDNGFNVQLKAITGFSALGGNHWLDIRGNWPALAMLLGPMAILRQLDARLTLDADAAALAVSPAADALQVYEQQGWTHIRGSRAHTQMLLAPDSLSINGSALPRQLLFADTPDATP